MLKFSDATQQATFKIIDQWLRHQIRFSSFPGIQICIRKKSEIVFHQAYGCADQAIKTLLTTDHLFHIASHSKSITACIILMLMEQGKLSLHDPAVNYIPELRHHSDDRFQQITIRDLLSQRSGIFRDSDDAGFWKFNRPFLTASELMQTVLDAPLVTDSNIKSKYSNIGYGLLGLIIENITDMTYDQAVKQHIIAKLGLQNTFADYTSDLDDRMATGYSKPLEHGIRVGMKHQPTHTLAAATGFCSTAADISLFMYEMLQGDKLLTRRTQRELMSLNWLIPNSQAKQHYGLGLQFQILNNNNFVGHSGGYPGFTTLTVHWQDTDYIFSILLNGQDGNRVMGICQSIADVMQKLAKTFDNDKPLMVTPILMSNWESILLVLAGKKGLCFYPELRSLDQTISELTASNMGDTNVYYCVNENGYESPGEAITVDRDVMGNVNRLKWGGDVMMLPDDLIRHIDQSMCRPKSI